MRPEKINKLPIEKTRKMVYILIFIICIVAIGIALYYQYFEDEKIGIIFGISDQNAEREERLSELKANFNSTFDNTLTDKQKLNYSKIDDEKEVIYDQYTNNEQNENYTLDVNLPLININSNVTDQYNKEIKSVFQKKAESIISKNSSVHTIYTVKYKAYIINNILSLVIRSELKEGSNSQRLIIQTYNYNLTTNKEVKLSELLDEKNISKPEANKQIKIEIEKKKEQNEQLKELGYNMYVREYSSEIHDIENTTEFFIDEEENLYLIYAYGNEDYTSEIDIVIF